jgi:SAM-dependent methyltransferase
MTIKEKIESFGIVDRQSYINFRNDYHEKGIAAYKDKIELLHPDNIDSGDFWEYIDNNFDNSVCGYGQTDIDQRLSVEQQNIINFQFAINTNSIGEIFTRAYIFGPTLPVLEIGPGYGSIARFLERVCDYKGIDVYPKYPGVIKTDGKSIPFDDESFYYVFASNVFQHLSFNQIEGYINEANRVLKPGGRFIFTIILNNDSPNIMHYGQFTETPTMDWLASISKDKFYLISSHYQLYNQVSTLTLGKM